MRSISFKIFAFMVSLLSILLFLLNYYPVVASRDRIIEQKRSSLTGQASVISSSLSALSSLSAPRVDNVLSVLDPQGYTRIVICDPQGSVLYNSRESHGRDFAADDLAAALDRQTVFRSGFSVRSRAFVCSYAMPINHEGKLTGAVFIYEHDSENAYIVLDLRSRILSLSLYIGAAALAASLLFSLSFFRRLKSMSRSMKIVGSGDYSHRLDVSGSDELSELGYEFNALTQKLEENERQRRQFVADASHELKTPLASIRLLSDSIVQNSGMDHDTVREFVADIGSEAYRLQRTTEKLLDLSRLDDKSLKMAPEPVDIKQVAMDVLAVLSPLAREKNVRIRSRLSDGCVVMANTDDMYRIIFNLTENAIKYNLNGGSVDLVLCQEEGSICLTVEDTGIGIQEEERLNIFARFYRVDKARSREAGGSGLGLSIVHDAVTAHGGSISVGANNPRGSRFIVRFPVPGPDETGI